LGKQKFISQVPARVLLEDVHIEQDECKICHVKVGTKSKGKYLKFHVHHKDGDHNNNNPHNVVLLCHVCHSRVHSFMRGGFYKDCI
jgi:5-methylcytosine-specific restriction endonuclease McrA